MKESRKSWRFCLCWCVKLKQLPFSLMYLLFRQNDCLHCKCGISRHITILHYSLHTSQAAHQDCGYIRFTSVAWSNQEHFNSPPPPPLDGMVVHRRVTSGGKFCTVNFTLRRNKLIISRSQLCFWFFINVSFLSKRQLCTFFSALSSPLILLLLRIKISRARWPPYFALGRVALERIQIFPTFGEEKNWQKFRKYQILVVVALDEHVGTKTLPIEIYVTRSIFLS